MGDFGIDLHKYYSIEFGTPTPPWWRRAKLWVTNPGLHCVAVYRLGRATYASLRRGNWAILPGYLLYEVLCFLVKMFHHVDIFSAKIGPGFYIGHVGTLYIGRCRIGSNCSVTHNVTIGMGMAEGSAGVPSLGDDVWVGTGSVLYGGIRVGDGVTLNSGSILSRSLPDRCLAGGNPARVLMQNHDNARMFRGLRMGAYAQEKPAPPLPAAEPATLAAAPIVVAPVAPAVQTPARMEPDAPDNHPKSAIAA